MATDASPPRATLVLIAGLPGSGKTTLADAYAARYGGATISNDRARAALGLRGHYDLQDKERVYAAVRAQTRDALSRGETVLVDGTFFQQSTRDAFASLAAECGADLFWIETRADEAVLKARVSKPRPDSEADVAVYERVRDQFEPFETPRLVVYTDTTPIAEAAAQMRRYITNRL